MKRIIATVLLGLLVLCPVQSMFSSEPSIDSKVAALNTKISTLQKQLGIKKKTLPGGRVVMVRRRVTKYDSAHKQELNKQLQAAKKQLENLLEQQRKMEKLDEFESLLLEREAEKLDI